MRHSIPLLLAAGIAACSGRSPGVFTGDGVYAVLPCNLVVRISDDYLCDVKGTPMEGRGNQPDFAGTPSIGDFLSGKDPVLDKAIAVLKSVFCP